MSAGPRAVAGTRRSALDADGEVPGGEGHTAGTRRVLTWLVVAIGVVTALVLASPPTAPPYDITSEQPDGTDILRRVLVALGTEVVQGDAADLAPRLRVGDVAVVFRDQLDADQERLLRDHVARGGRLVVAAPSAAPAGGQSARPGVGADGPPDCRLVSATARIRVDVDVEQGRSPNAVPDLVELDLPPDEACWSDDGAALVAAYDGALGPGGRLGGSGETVVLGDADLVTNVAIQAQPELGQLASLFLPATDDGRMVVLVGSRPPPAAIGLPGELPGHLRRGLWLAGLAGVLYALARARRLGRVLVESPPVRVPASALARGIAALLERHGRAGDAALRLREELRVEVGARLGGSDPAVPDLVPLVVRATGLPDDVVLDALGDQPVTSSDHLARVAGAGRSVRWALAPDRGDGGAPVRGGDRPAPPDDS